MLASLLFPQTLLAAVPDLTIATDIICGFPGESESPEITKHWRGQCQRATHRLATHRLATHRRCPPSCTGPHLLHGECSVAVLLMTPAAESDHAATLRLVEKYQFPILNISQFFPRPGTPAARMPRVPTHVVKERTREVSALFASYTTFDKLVGTELIVLVTEVASDGISLVAHTKAYAQVLIPRVPEHMGCQLRVRITSAAKFYVKAEVLEVLARPRQPAVAARVLEKAKAPRKHATSKRQPAVTPLTGAPPAADATPPASSTKAAPSSSDVQESISNTNESLPTCKAVHEDGCCQGEGVKGAGCGCAAQGKRDVCDSQAPEVGGELAPAELTQFQPTQAGLTPCPSDEERPWHYHIPLAIAASTALLTAVHLGRRMAAARY